MEHFWVNRGGKKGWGVPTGTPAHIALYGSTLFGGTDSLRRFEAGSSG